MGVKKLDTQMVFQDAAHLYVTPYDADGVTLKTTTYDIRAIVADSISVEQDDNETNTKEWEFGDTPLLENITLGKFNFAATCVDFQNDIMCELFGCEKQGEMIVFPSTYKDLFVCVRITFANANSKDVIIPRLRLDSKAVIGTLKTGSAEGTISGTAYATEVAPSAQATAVVETPMFFAPHPSTEGSSTWQIQDEGGSNISTATNTDKKFSAIDYTPAT